MKLRILDDSIRLRLSQGDVQQAGNGGPVEGQTRFPGGGVFTYALEVLEQGPATASYSADRLTVGLPASEVTAWAGDDTAVSIHADVALAGGDPLKLLVEKDFRCLTDRDDEDQSDLFTNPQKGEC